MINGRSKGVYETLMDLPRHTRSILGLGGPDPPEDHMLLLLQDPTRGENRSAQVTRGTASGGGKPCLRIEDHRPKLREG